MVTMDCGFESSVLNTRVNLKVILPHKIDYMNRIENYEEYYKFNDFKMLLLLHGAWDDANSWLMNTSVLRYADDNNIALVMPSVGNSFYMKQLSGEDYFKFVTEEVLGFARSMFPISKERKDTFVGGNSMGGFGAMKIALERPDLFSKAFSLSGALDLQESARLLRSIGINVDNTFENVRKINGTADDLFVIMEEAVNKKLELPEIYQAVGTRDYMYKGNLKFKEKAHELNLPVLYEEAPGEHDWKFWDEYVEKAILWCLK